MAATRACMNAVVCQAAPAVSTKATRVSVARPVKSTRGMKVVSMAAIREDVIEFETQGHLPEEIANFDYGHADGHHMWKKADASGFVAGDGHAKWKQHIANAMEESGGPKGPMSLLVLGSVPASFAILMFGGGTPETSGVGLLVLAAVVSAVTTAAAQLEEMAALKETDEIVKA
eukprot:CAMPEP_0118934894 /NCGR_PEP_ID=MMETSP1169-20130426/14434_1 /TAXON_ID=36882 /ORGANISM="Pyramimonas obovata, Strain CCMP722" /LENGTH=173 /DNA_ID=CAMNT_0006877853 /DNA_START=57 /DNA_END=578 /DNA_ORIENTATION=+